MGMGKDAFQRHQKLQARANLAALSKNKEAMTSEEVKRKNTKEEIG